MPELPDALQSATGRSADDADDSEASEIFGETMILFSCPACAVAIRAGPEHATRKVDCPRCDATFAVPELPECDLVKLVAEPMGWRKRIGRRIRDVFRSAPTPMAGYGD